MAEKTTPRLKTKYTEEVRPALLDGVRHLLDGLVGGGGRSEHRRVALNLRNHPAPVAQQRGFGVPSWRHCAGAGLNVLEGNDRFALGNVAQDAGDNGVDLVGRVSRVRCQHDYLQES